MSRSATTGCTTSITELYREDITRFRPVLAPDDYDDPFAELAAGRIPTLPALRLHTGTVWRWNRGCYGITDGVPHLRIENRVLPSGPTVVDEVANAALWLGLMRADRRPPSGGQPDAAVRGRPDQLRERRPPGPRRPSRRGSTAPSTRRRALALDVLLPLAAEGLASVGVADEDRTRYLGVIERRVRSGHTGSRWLLGSLNAMRNQGTAGPAPEQPDGGDGRPPARRLTGRRVDAGQPRRGRRSGATTS